MRGRKPVQGAVRRGLSDAYSMAEPGDARGVTMPEDVASDPMLSKIWSWLVPPVNDFTLQDMPALRLLTFWHAVAAQAQQVLFEGDGTIGILDQVGVKGFGDGEPLMRKSPAVSVLKEASSEIRALSDMLGLSPLARSRIGLMSSGTTKSAAETAAIFMSIDAHYKPYEGASGAVGELPGSQVL
jgi:hypothetical protein